VIAGVIILNLDPVNIGDWGYLFLERIIWSDLIWFQCIRLWFDFARFHLISNVPSLRLSCSQYFYANMDAYRHGYMAPTFHEAIRLAWFETIHWFNQPLLWKPVPIVIQKTVTIVCIRLGWFSKVSWLDYPLFSKPALISGHNVSTNVCNETKWNEMKWNEVIRSAQGRTNLFRFVEFGSLFEKILSWITTIDCTNSHLMW
jgi:hypothetical protein